MFVIEALAAGAETAAHGAAHAAEHGGEHGGSFPPFDTSTFASQLFWLLLTFGFLYWFMSRVIVPRLGNILETRQDRIAQDLDRAHELKSEADAAFAAYEQELAQAKATANDIGNKARDAAKSAAETERQKVEAELADKLAEAETRIKSIRDTAMADVGAIAAETAEAVVKQLIGGTVTKAQIDGALKSAGN
ncbi:F0F1 ATP synthase subunit B [Oricola sp.]|uniref:F0F1 ATP synthase subunit B n=1 Tax=Oricola sp. TaxID=1979950 RepID=UPI003BAD39A2